MPKELFMGVEIISSMMFGDAGIRATYAPDDADFDDGAILVADAGDYLSDEQGPSSEIQNEIDTLHVYIGKSMRSLEEVIRSIESECSKRIVKDSIRIADDGLSNYEPRSSGSDELLNLSHARIDAFRLAKNAQRLAFLCVNRGTGDNPANETEYEQPR